MHRSAALSCASIKITLSLRLSLLLIVTKKYAQDSSLENNDK